MKNIFFNLVKFIRSHTLVDICEIPFPEYILYIKKTKYYIWNILMQGIFILILTCILKYTLCLWWITIPVLISTSLSSLSWELSFSILLCSELFSSILLCSELSSSILLYSELSSSILLYSELSSSILLYSELSSLILLWSELSSLDID